MAMPCSTGYTSHNKCNCLCQIDKADRVFILCLFYLLHVIFNLFVESIDKASIREEEENLKNSSESLQNNQDGKKEKMDVKNSTITDIESPSVETTKGISTSTSGDSISVSECNGHVSPVKEETDSSSHTAGVNSVVCDENSMDQGVEETDGVKSDQVVDVESLMGEEKGHGDGSLTNTGKVVQNVNKSCGQGYVLVPGSIALRLIN